MENENWRGIEQKNVEANVFSYNFTFPASAGAWLHGWCGVVKMEFCELGSANLLFLRTSTSEAYLQFLYAMAEAADEHDNLYNYIITSVVHSLWSLTTLKCHGGGEISNDDAFHFCGKLY